MKEQASNILFRQSEVSRVMLRLTLLLTTILLALATTPARAAEPPLDLGGVTERHEMIPMRDGVRLSTYLYVPPGEGPWPVLLEQRYADVRGANTREAMARLAKGGYVVAV